MGLKTGKVLSTAIKKNRADIEILTCVVEIRKNQNVTAEWFNAFNESVGPLTGDWVVIAPRDQTYGGYLAFGFIDIINQLFAAGGVKIIFGRDAAGSVKTKITLTDSEIIIENPSTAKIVLSDDKIILNSGTGAALEAQRLQTVLTNFSQAIVTEFGRVAAGVLLNPTTPYVPAPTIPVDISAARSETVNLP